MNQLLTRGKWKMSETLNFTLKGDDHQTKKTK